jgi:hypothetical protein
VYQERFAKAHGPLRPVVERVLRAFLTCGLVERGFARAWCGTCRFLGYYTHRVGISGHRLLAIDATTVPFKTRGTKTATLQGEEFIRRFLLHVLPRGFVKIRHYGLLAAKAQDKRELVRSVLPPETAQADASDEAAVDRPLTEPAPVTSTSLIEFARLCPSCGRSILVRRPLQERPPPNTVAGLP